MNLVLLGDSILDNGAYVPDGPPVVEQLRGRLSGDWQVTLLAQDGACVEDVLRQLDRLPKDATHLLISAGGNDALLCSSLVNSPQTDSGTILTELTIAVSDFRARYQQLIRAIRTTNLPAITCTIYDAVPDLQSHERMALSLFNDLIIRESAVAHFPILDLRRVCDERSDYSTISPIEPSEAGGSKITRAAQKILLGHDFSRGESVIFP